MSYPLSISFRNYTSNARNRSGSERTARRPLVPLQSRSTIINKTPSGAFRRIESEGTGNLEAKTAICEQIENIDFPALKSFKDWEEKNKEVIALQDKWKTIGFAPKKSNVKIFERFRAACDVYFNRKSEFYKNIKDEMEKNLALKKALCEKAEALKDSTDWKSTTEKMIALQKRMEDDRIGSPANIPMPSGSASSRLANYFFEQKNKNVSSQKSVEQTNLAAKKTLNRKRSTQSTKPTMTKHLLP